MATLDTSTHSRPTQSSLSDALAEVARRVRRQRQGRGAARGLSAALLLDCLLAGLRRAEVLPPGPLFWATLGLVAGAGALLGAWLAARTAVPPMDAACLAEAHLPLKERLSSALAFAAAPPVSVSNPLLLLQRQDAETHARHLDTRRVVPRRLPRELWLAAALLLALALTLGLPNLPLALTPAQRGEQETVQAAGRALTQAAQEAAHRTDIAHQPQAAQAARQMARLGRRMAQGHMDRAQALAAVSRQEQQLAQASAPASPPQASPDPGQAARSLAGAGSQSPAVHPSAPPPPASLPKHPSPASAARTGHGTGHPAPTASSPPGASSSGGSQRASSPSVATPAGSAPPPPGAAPKPGMVPSSSSSSPAAAPSAQKLAAGKTSSLRQALQDARRRLTGSPPPGQQKSGPQKSASAPPAAGSGSPHSPGGTGKPGGQKPGSGMPSPGQTSGGQAGQGKPSGPGAPGQNAGKAGGLSSPSAPGSGASGGGPAAKMPFHSALPPAPPAKNQGIYLGRPSGPSGKETSLPKQSGLPSALTGPSRVPYGHALPAYRSSAEAALSREQVPPSQRAVVRDYFNSLQPAK